MTTRERILQAAIEAFERDGLDGLSMRKLAASLGLTPMALYRHVADKQELVDAVALHGLECWRTRVAAIAQAAPLAWLEAMGEAFLDFSLQTPRLYEAAFLLRAHTARRFPDDFLAGRSPPVAMVVERIEAARQAGLIGDAPAHEVAIAIWAMAQGLVELNRAGRFAGDEAYLRGLYRSLLRRCIASFSPGAPA